jgi:hypothetical protein
VPSAQRDALITALLLSPRMQALWDVHDRGMPVFTHSLDVALLCLDRAQLAPELDLDAIVFGALVHDYSKLPREDGRSHSYLMRNDPDTAADASMELLAEGERKSGVAVDPARRAHVRHIVLSHHGTWGKVHPRTPEAWLVAECDQLSGTEHRLAPLDANDLLPLLSEGYRWKEAAALLGVGRELVKARLREACQAEGVREWVHLLPIWRSRGSVRAGTERRQQQLARARLVDRLARQVPDCLLDRLNGPSRTPATASQPPGLVSSHGSHVGVDG